MSNYTKTTDFEAKDSLPTGDSGKIIRGAEFETEFDAISTAIATKADTAGPTFTGTLTFETISDGTIGVTAFVDEDNMASNSATLVPTQQSVKAYVDSQVTAQDLDFQADTGGALSIDLDSETLTFTGGTGIDTSGLGNAVTFAIDSTVATLTGTQTLTNKTLTSPDVNTPDIDGGTIDGTVIGGTTPAAVSATTVSATGNITVGGTVDGRDVATDGTKLDGIEAGATADQTAAEIRTLVDSATDSNVFTDADHTKLDGIEASADVTDTANVTAAGAVMDSELTSEASVKALDQGVATTDSPTFAGVTVNGTVEFDGLSGTGAVSVTDILDQDDMSSNSATALATQQSIKAYVDSQVATADTLSEVLANGNTTGGTDIAVGTGDDITFADSSKAIFGAGSDLQIYHDGSHSYVKDAGTGILYVQGSGQVRVGGADGTTGVEVNEGGDVKLRYNNANKLATTSTGIDVTGVITTDGMTTSADINFGDNDKAVFGASGDLQIYHDGSNSYIKDLGTGDLLLSGNTGVQIQSDAGENMITTAANGAVSLFYDASAKLATTSTGIDVTGTAVTDGLTVEGSNSVAFNAATFYNADTTVNSSVDLTFNCGSSGTATAKIKAIREFSGYSDLAFQTEDNDNLRTRLLINSSGDISFYEDTGTTAKLFWDASAERLGLGTSSPDTPLHISTNVQAVAQLESSHANGSYAIWAVGGTKFGDVGSNKGISGSGNTTDFMIASRSTYPLLLGTGSTERLRIDSNGNVGIGTSNPDAPFTIQRPSNNQGIAAGLSLKGQDGTTQGGLGTDGVNDNAVQLVAAQFIKFHTSNTDGTANERMRIDSSGNLLVGTTTYNSANQGILLGATGVIYSTGTSGISASFGRNTTDGSIVNFRKDNSTVGSIGVEGGDLTIGTDTQTGLHFWNNAAIRPWNITANTRADAVCDLGESNTRFKDLYLSGVAYANNFVGVSDTDTGIDINGTNVMKFNTGGSERARFDSSGNLLVGKTAANFTVAGHEIKPGGFAGFTRDGGAPIVATRLTSDGNIIEFYKGTSSVGSIGTESGYLAVGSSHGQSGYLGFRSNMVYPSTSTGGNRDDSIDLGGSSQRFDDVYATNGTIQTSDRNEKQDIEALSDAEQRVAVACKGLLRKFRWKSSVTENGDDARIHFGIIAQDLQAAFTAEGLDAGRYAMFISTTWTDEETGEERTRMGVRYSELLAFIIAAI